MTWYEEMKKTEPNVVCILVGNKVDCEELREVSFQEGQRLAQTHEMMFMECSAKTDHNIRNVFETLLNAIDFDDNSIAFQENDDLKLNKSSSSDKNCC